MKTIRTVLIDHNLSRISDRIESVTKKSVRLSSEKRSSDATNRLGGRPNLPKGLEWPTWREQPLAFVAQFDLASLPLMPDLPRRGLGHRDVSAQKLVGENTSRFIHESIRIGG
jgi:uncharacterized protein YwqG